MTSDKARRSDSSPRALRPLVRAAGAVVRGVRPIARRTTAAAARRGFRLLERVSPAAARRIHPPGWVWQPDMSPRRLYRFYANKVDPYGFDSNPYETAKYQHTLSLLGQERYGAALEIGAAEGASPSFSPRDAIRS